MKKKNEDQLKKKDKELSLVISYDYKEDLMSVSDHPDIVDPIIDNIMENIKTAIKYKKNEIEVCVISNHNMKINLHRSNFEESLNYILKKYEEDEDFDKCIEIKNLIEQL